MLFFFNIKKAVHTNIKHYIADLFCTHWKHQRFLCSCCYIVCVACFIFATHPKTITHTFNSDYNVLYKDKRFELHVCVYVSPVD